MFCSITDVIGLGAGVQSSALVCLAANRDQRLLDAMGHWPDVAIFGDTQSEPANVYTHLDALVAYCGARGFPIHTATAGSLERAIREDDRFSSIPCYTKTDGKLREGIFGRNCTRDHKIYPVARKTKELCGIKRRGRMPHRVRQWIGISIDEAQRMRSSGPIAWQDLVYPLIEMRWSRIDCHRYLAECGFDDVPKSSCVFCPYHNDNAWLRMKRTDPESWARAVDFDLAIRNIRDEGRGGVKSVLYLHQSLVPLDQVELGESQLDLFGNECHGYCGI
jgi:hypothetical protein